MLKWQSEAIAHEDNGLKKMLTVDRPTGLGFDAARKKKALLN